MRPLSPIAISWTWTTRRLSKKARSLDSRRRFLEGSLVEQGNNKSRIVARSRHVGELMRDSAQGKACAGPRAKACSEL
jgi:hypothetical protein